MKIVRQNSEFFEEKMEELLARRYRLFEQLESDVDPIIKNVQRDPETALLHYSREFDDVSLTPEQLWIDPDLIKNSHKLLTSELRNSIEATLKRVERFNQELRTQSFQMQDESGVYWGVEVRPYQRVGFYVPRNYFISLLVAAVPAQQVGVEDLIVATPASAHLGEPYVHPSILYVCKLLEIDKILVAGGVAALAALANGLNGCPPVEKIVGPTLRMGMLAKQKLSHLVGIDGFVGPSEVAFVTDRSTSVDVVAADMTAIADHNPDAEIFVLSTQEKWMQSLLEALVDRAEAIKEKEGREGVRACLESKTSFFVVEDIAYAVETANRLCPAVLSLVVKDAAQYLPRVNRCGAVLLGGFTPPSAFDLVAGATGLLPTLGSSAFFSASGPSQYLRQIRVLEMDKAALKRLKDDSLGIASVDDFSTREGIFTSRLTD